MVLHELPTGAMVHLDRFLDQAEDAGARLQQEFPPACVPIRSARSCCRSIVMFPTFLEEIPYNSVWTGRALQAEIGELAAVGLAHLYPALEWSSMLLAIMDIRAHPVSFSTRP